MPKKKKRSYRPIRLKQREIGRQRCEMVKGPRGHKMQLCVKANPYGYTGHLYPYSGSGAPLPVSVGNARSMKAAMSSAKQFLRRVKMKSKRGGR